MRILGILQNAWSPLYAGGTWPRESWLKALWKSRSGQRLSIITERLMWYDFYFDNTTPLVGEEPNSIIKPDFYHVVCLILKVRPSLILTFGKQAEEVLNKIVEDTDTLIPVINCKHPAYRNLTNKEYIDVVDLIKEMFDLPNK